jgi:hypothetical protein
MWRFQLKYQSTVGPLIILALLLYNIPLYSQVPASNDSIKRSQPFRIASDFNCVHIFLNNTLLKNQYNLIPAKTLSDETASIFLDSLKVKASKNVLTRRLYDYLILTNESASAKHITQSSELNFLKYSGKKIRKIEIRRLNVFGSDINNPFSGKTNNAENILNKTHLNTNEFIIRKNLLFSEGDTISPLLISDNERILRKLPYIDDSRIIIVPVSDEDVDLVVLTKDVYSLGANYEYSSIKKGFFSLYEKNILGLGHEFKLNIPYDKNLPDSPGFGVDYYIDNIGKSFINLNLYFFDGLGEKTYGFGLERKLISSTTKYAGGISVREMFTTVDIDTIEPLKYNLQDYWLMRSWLLSEKSVTRLIIGARYTNNNVFTRPFILPDSYHYLQKYKMFLGSAAISVQKFYRTNLIYEYGRTEDIPHGGLLNLTFGKEINEFQDRFYAGANISAGQSIRNFGYSYFSAGLSTFFHHSSTERGILLLRSSFFSNLIYLENYRIRNFIKVDYTRGFGRFSNENLVYNSENGFSGFKNDSVSGQQRLSLSLESVLFSPVKYYGFRFAFFAFTDLGLLFGTNETLKNGDFLSSIGLGIRIRNNNLVFNTLQIRFCFYLNLPQYSKVNYFSVSGEQLLEPNKFDPGPPTIIPYQ